MSLGTFGYRIWHGGKSRFEVYSLFDYVAHGIAPQCVNANVWKQWPTNLELISSRHLVTRVSQLSVSDSISIRSWIHCSLLAGASNPVDFIQRSHDG